MLSWSTFFITEELKKRGYSIEIFDSEYLARVSKDNTTFFLHTSITPTLKATSYILCKDKYLTRQIMKQGNFSTPEFEKIDRNSIDKTSKMKFPVVIKPLDLFGGKDVVVGVNSTEEVKDYLLTRPQYSEVIVEGMLKGDDVRILIVRGKFFAAVTRRPAFVVGDGKHTIKELVEIENRRRQLIADSDKKNNTYTTDLLPIVFDDESQRVLKDNGMSETYVANIDESVSVRKNANVSTGGISVDVTDQVCGEIKDECERLAKELDMTLAGIDIMTTDLSKPLDIMQQSGIVEVNASPGLDLHILTDEGQRRNPVPLIVDEIEEYLQNQKS